MNAVVAISDDPKPTTILGLSLALPRGLALPPWVQEWHRDCGWHPTDAALQRAEVALREASKIILAPAPKASLTKLVAILVGSWPNANPPDPDVYVAGMRMHLARYPAEVIGDAISTAQRTLKFLPAIAEMVELCEEDLRRREIILGYLDVVRRKKHDAMAAAHRTRTGLMALETDIPFADLALAYEKDGRFVCWWAEWGQFDGSGGEDSRDAGRAKILALAAQARAEGVPSPIEIVERD